MGDLNRYLFCAFLLLVSGIFCSVELLGNVSGIETPSLKGVFVGKLEVELLFRALTIFLSFNLIDSFFFSIFLNILKLKPITRLLTVVIYLKNNY